MATGPREYTDSDYPQVLERWTRTKSLVTLSELDTLLTVTATFESWDFRWAYVVKYANDYRLTVEQRRTLLERTLAETQDSHRFYVALYGTNVRWADLTRPNSAWIVRLIDDEGNETAPLSIELIARPGPLERRYFPYSTVWRNVFRIKFPTTTPERTADDRARRALVRSALRGRGGQRGAALGARRDRADEAHGRVRTAAGHAAERRSHPGEHFEQRRARHEQLLRDRAIAEEDERAARARARRARGVAGAEDLAWRRGTRPSRRRR